jgi:hypothetical protein
MGVDDRVWTREDRKRRAKLVWNDRSGELEFSTAGTASVVGDGLIGCGRTCRTG